MFKVWYQKFIYFLDVVSQWTHSGCSSFCVRLSLQYPCSFPVSVMYNWRSTSGISVTKSLLLTLHALVLCLYFFLVWALWSASPAAAAAVEQWSNLQHLLLAWDMVRCWTVPGKCLGWGVILSLTRACWGWAGGKLCDCRGKDTLWLQPFTCTSGAGNVHHPQVTVLPCRNSFHHLAPVFPQELKTLTCWDMSAASREVKGRPGWGGDTHSPCHCSIPQGMVLVRAPQPHAACLCCWRRLHRLCTPWVLPCTCWVLWELPWCLTFPGAPLVRYHGCDGALTWCTRTRRSSAFGRGSLCVQLLNFIWVWGWTWGCCCPVWEPVRLGAAGAACAGIFPTDADTVYVWDKHWAADAQRGAENFWEF